MQTTQNSPIETLLRAIAENLEHHAREAKLSRLDLAALTGLNRNTIGSALAGGDVKLSTLIRLSRALGQTDWLQILIQKPEPSPMELLQNKKRSIKKQSAAAHPPSANWKKPGSRNIGRMGEQK